MGFIVFFAMSALLLISFANVPKKLKAKEYVFVWLAFVAVFVTWFDMSTPRNSEFLKLTEDPMLYTAQRMWELLAIPLVLLLYLNTLRSLSTTWGKIAATVFVYVVLYGMEWLAVGMKLFSYAEWKPWWSAIVWGLALLYAALLQKGMHALLRKERSAT